MSFGQVFYVYWSTLCRLVNFMSFGQVLYVVWSTLCRLVKFYMSTGQLNVVWSSFICLLVNFHIRSRKADLPFAIRARKLRKLGSSAFRGTYRECTYNRNSRKAVNLISFIYLILVENVTFGPQILWKIRKLGPQI